MITSKGGRGIPFVLKLSQYVRYYQNRYGVLLSGERAHEEAAKEGFVLDRSGESTGEGKLSCESQRPQRRTA